MNIDDLKNLIKKGQFNNPTKGQMNLKEVVGELVDFRREDPESKYRIVIGTDSQERERGADFVSVVAIHRIGKGGRYFWLRSYDKQSKDMRNRIYKEATMSLALAQALLEQELENNHIPIIIGQSIREAIEKLEKNSVGISDKEIILSNELEIHVDIGNSGPTRAMIKEIVGMIRGSGFDVKIKPEAFAAANVADKHL
jgi:predicted RNase H-related nuclease YkuK (DUF458 family)